jgi:hypothetical protein
LVVDKLYEGDWVSISHTGSGLTRGGRSQDLGHYWRRAIGLQRRRCVVEIILKAGQAQIRVMARDQRFVMQFGTSCT